MRRSTYRSAVLAAGMIAALGVPASLQAEPRLQMLDSVQPGLWELRYRGDATPQRLCIHSGAQLLQLRFRSEGCERHAIVDKADEVTVQQTCRGADNNFTRIRRESPKLLQMESQGIAAGNPFSFTAEMREVGSC